MNVSGHGQTVYVTLCDETAIWKRCNNFDVSQCTVVASIKLFKVDSLHKTTISES